MKKLTYLTCIIAILLLSSFRQNLDCKYVKSNLEFAKSQIQEALLSNDFNKARFFTFKALNALEKSKGQLNQCGCTFAQKSMGESLDILILATKSTTLKRANIYLNQSMQLTNSTVLILDAHDSHNSTYVTGELALNMNSTPSKNTTNAKVKTFTLNDKIDISLEKYQISLNKVVETVNCKDARSFAQRIFEECESQLLKEDLSEGKKYYNLRTREITLEALNRIGNCARESSLSN